MDYANIVTGDNVVVPVTLKKNGVVFDMSGATVKVRLISTDHESVYTGEITQNEAATGADWANSLVILELAPADTSGISFQGNALIEIQVDQNGKTTWFVSALITKGNIA